MFARADKQSDYPPPKKKKKKKKNLKNIGFLSNTDRDPLKNYKATKPAFNVGPMKARFEWYLDPLIN